MKLTRRVLVSMFALGAVCAGGVPAARAADAEESVNMTLGECLQRALENNLDLRVVLLNPESARLGTTFQDAIFDPVLGANVFYSSDPSDVTQTVNSIVAPTGHGSDKSWGGSARLDQLLNFGGSYFVSLTPTFSDSTSPSLFDAATNSVASGSGTTKHWNLTAGFNLPLLKGLGKETTQIAVLQAKYNENVSEEDLKQAAQGTVKATEDAYWDVAAARAAVNVANQSLKLAKDLYDLNKKKVEVGTLAPIEITQAEAGVASREEGVIVAENALRNAEDNLRRELAVPAGDPLWSKRLLPTEKPKEEPVAIDLDAALSTALETRPEILSARVKLDAQRLSERVAKQNVKHKLDLQVQASSDRLNIDSESQNTFLPPNPALVTSTFSRETKSEPGWRAALIYAYPFGNHAAKSNYAIAQIGREQAEIAEASAEQNVRVDVRAAARAVESGAKRVAAAKSNTVLQQKTVDAELKKFENGMSTSFEVLRIQTDLTSAQLAEIQALLDYNKALADFERAKGTLLEAKGLTMTTPEKEK